MYSMRIKLFSFILLLNVFQTFSFANDESDSEFSSDYNEPCNPLLDNKFKCFPGQNDCSFKDMVNKDRFIGLTEGFKCDGKIFQKYGTRAVCLPQGDSSFAKKYGIADISRFIDSVDMLNASEEGMPPNILFSDNHDEKIVPCEQHSECGKYTFCNQVYFSAEEKPGIHDIDRFNRKIANKFKGLFNIPYDYELVDENNDPYKKLCMPHGRCLPDCTKEGELLQANSYCCPGLVQGRTIA